ncbi:penicillin-binding protein 1A [Pseudomonas sp. BJa3]|uniref:penicillin-binding protein 1A n=1 Tax=Pseudomonas sp. BJa3 TaxID=2986525 RepID=UPI002265AD9F|nr:penicillin-binding protein 1A [Pseudomonas sp. BJa3]MCX5506712.1 penicillin-binding protein 1A [Pseudomonas sp. BJa3]
MRLIKALGWCALSLASVLVLGASGTYLYLNPQLPDVETLRAVQLQEPLQVFSAEGKLIAEFGEVRRIPLPSALIPGDFLAAFMAAEDADFYHHRGVDPTGLLRAAMELIRNGHVRSGGSTITMQVAKNFFLSKEKTFSRKLTEILLALRIERTLTKDEIFNLYVNKIYLGKRAYGIAAAAQVYYGKPVSQLTLAQTAMIAGLPKAPSRFNPINNPARAKQRRDWILGRMHALGSIDQARYRAALEAPVTARYHAPEPEVSAPYIAEMVRAQMVSRFGDDAYTQGFRVVTTVSGTLQEAANAAIRSGLKTYDKRHGYRGPEGHLTGSLSPAWLERLKEYPVLGGLEAMAVTKVFANRITVVDQTGQQHDVAWQTMEWARPFINHSALGRQPARPADIVTPGDVVRVELAGSQPLAFSQVPDVQGALVSVAPDNGAIKALVGGFDFNQSVFNRVVQAKRQPGSSFKPFIYCAALDNGYTPASIVNDAPIVLGNDYSGPTWRPQNENRTFLGPIRLREALYRSRNMISIRLLQAMGIDPTIDYISRFGFDVNDMPRNLSLALGTASVTPMAVVGGWSVLANGGYKVTPFLIDRIENRSGRVVFKAAPRSAPSARNPAPEAVAEQVVDSRTTYLLTSMLQDVIKRGTGRAASALHRPDIAGKTGTTNEAKDSWFTGYNGNYVTSVWAGFDKPQSLGRREWGVTIALPIWMDYMQVALAGTEPYSQPAPDGVVTRLINTADGTATSARGPQTEMEVFKAESAPAMGTPQGNVPSLNATQQTLQDLF